MLPSDSGECQYLLARDFIDGNFTVMATYSKVNERLRKVVNVISNGRQIDIAPDFKVTVDNMRIELPIYFGNTTVTREGNEIVIENKKGVTVRCHMTFDRCTLELSGWYYGKTAGLFGTFDNEWSTDFIKPDGSRAADELELVNSWAIGRKCSVSIPYPTFEKKNPKCAVFTDQSSPFRPCFRQVEPKDFELHCNMMSNDFCQIASFYVSECRMAGVPLTLPSECVSCSLPNNDVFKLGDKCVLSKSSNQAPIRSADIVIAIEHNSCNKPTVENLKTLVDLIERSMADSYMKDVRYAIVGYGGEMGPSKAHVHTMDGLIFNKAGKFDAGIANFNVDKIMTATTTALDAIMFAASKLPYRAGVSKSIILLPCTTCQESSSVRYADVLRYLTETQISLHTLLPQEIKLKSKSPKASQIFGVDNDFVYTSKYQKTLKGDRELRQQVTVPKDICAALAQETEGTVFDTKTLTEGRFSDQKIFMDTFARVLTAKSSKISECQSCECTSDNTGMAIPICRSCDREQPIYDEKPTTQVVAPPTNDDRFYGDLQEYIKYKL